MNDILIQILILLLGFVMLIVGANYFVDGTSGIAKRFGIPELVIGLTIVALGTSAPEAAVSITAALNKSAELTVGNVLGSNILNIGIILGITSVIISIAVQKSTIKYEMPFMILVSVIMLIFGYTGGEINRIEGGIFWLLLIVYMVYLIKMSKNAPEESAPENSDNASEDAKKAPKKLWVLFIFAVIGLILIIKGSDFTVASASELAATFGLSKRLIGLTVVALGTSLPELVTSLTAAIKGKADIAMGNIVGSNILNILFVAGTTAIITPVVFASNFIIDGIVTIAIGVILLLCVIRTKSLRRIPGFILLACYAAYFVYLIK